MQKYSEDFLKKTIRIWQPYCPLPLTMDDAEEIAENMFELFSLLYELDQKYGTQKKKIQSKPN